MGTFYRTYNPQPESVEALAAILADEAAEPEMIEQADSFAQEHGKCVRRFLIGFAGGYGNKTPAEVESGQ